MLWKHIPAGTPCAHFLLPGANQGTGAPSCPRNPWRVQLRALVGGKVASCDAALLDFHLMLDFSPAPVPALQDWDRGVAKLGFVPSPSPQLLRVGQAMPRPPSEAPRCHGEGGRAGSPLCPTKAVQHKQSLLQQRCLGCCARNGFGCFPLLELPESGAKWQLPRCPGSFSICRDNLARRESLS